MNRRTEKTSQRIEIGSLCWALDR